MNAETDMQTARAPPSPAKTAGEADRELITLYEISKVLSSSLDFAKSVRAVLNILLSYLDMRHGVVSMAHQSEQLHIVGALDAVDVGGIDAILEVEKGVSGKILSAGMPMVIPNITEELAFVNRTGRNLAEYEGVAYVGVPIKVGCDCLGVLSICRWPDGGRRISFERDVRILSLVATLIGQTYQLHQSVAAEREQLMEDKHQLQKRLQGNYDIENIVGRSQRIKDVFADVHQAAPGSATVLFRGESGTGKEAVAHAIHYLSARAKGPFVKVNCSALSENLLESELFGHEKGAFTGAVNERKGRFEMANGGTLFLDEIGDITPSFQAKMLRVLQEHEFERVGGNKTIRTDFRLVAATNRNLEEAVKSGQFRADLYFRLNVVTIYLPPLRERKEDIPLLVDFFLIRYNRENNRNLKIAAEAVEIFKRCNWPGNVRELENCVERTATMTRGSVIREADMRCGQGQCFSSSLIEVTKMRSSFPTFNLVPVSATQVPAEPVPARITDGLPGAHASTGGGEPEYVSERERLIDAMEKCGRVQAKAGRLLGLTPRQMGYALKKYKVELKSL
jgi:Nif-specific regulatory protein